MTRRRQCQRSNRRLSRRFLTLSRPEGKQRGKLPRLFDTAWTEDITKWTFDIMSQEVLASMAFVSRKIDLKEAENLIAKVTMKHLRDIKSGRGSKRRILTNLREDDGALRSKEPHGRTGNAAVRKTISKRSSTAAYKFRQVNRRGWKSGGKTDN